MIKTTGNLADKYCKEIIKKILLEGGKDVNPRPHWEDGTPAHTYSINGAMTRYDLSKGEIPLLTLRAVPYKMAIKELLWIYQDASNDLDLLRDKYGVKWWDSWDIGDRTIGKCYGGTVKEHDLMHKLLNSIEANPDSRYHILNLWNEDDFKQPHGLKPCCFLTNFNVRHAKNGITYLDMAMYQRSADYLTAGCAANEIQYAIFLCMVANHFGYTPGIFTHFMENVQIYDRHINNATTMLQRKSIEYIKPKIWINPDKKDFYSLTPDDIKVNMYPVDVINKVNPQLVFPVAI